MQPFTRMPWQRRNHDRPHAFAIGFAGAPTCPPEAWLNNDNAIIKRHRPKHLANLSCCWQEHENHAKAVIASGHFFAMSPLIFFVSCVPSIGNEINAWALLDFQKGAG